MVPHYNVGSTQTMGGDTAPLLRGGAPVIGRIWYILRLTAVCLARQRENFFKNRRKEKNMLILFLVGHDSSTLEESSTIEYSAHALIGDSLPKQF